MCASHLGCLIMHKIGAGVASCLFVVAISLALQSRALAFRLGPFHIGLPFFGHRHHVARHAEGHPDAAAAGANATTYATVGPEAEPQSAASAFLYPGLALQALYGDIFAAVPAAPWPFSYDGIFRAAFAKSGAERDQQGCQQAGRGSAVVERIAAEIRPTASQRPLLLKLGGALGMASGFLAKACEQDIPAEPVARLKIMETRLQELTMALDIIRQPLQEFEQSLSQNQQKRLASAIKSPTPSERKNIAKSAAPSCAAAPRNVQWSVDQISQSLQPNDNQRDSLTQMKAAFDRAAGDLDAQCLMSLPSDALTRLETVEARLDAEWRATLTIQVALDDVESALSDDQRARFNALDLAAR
jgi:LTXXQ motif family protein